MALACQMKYLKPLYVVPRRRLGAWRRSWCSLTSASTGFTAASSTTRGCLPTREERDRAREGGVGGEGERGREGERKGDDDVGRESESPVLSHSDLGSPVW